MDKVLNAHFQAGSFSAAGMMDPEVKCFGGCAAAVTTLKAALIVSPCLRFLTTVMSFFCAYEESGKKELRLKAHAAALHFSSRLIRPFPPAFQAYCPGPSGGNKALHNENGTKA